MEKLTIPGSYRNSTSPRETTRTCDEWEGIPYRPNPNCPVCKGAGFVHPRDGEFVIYTKTVTCSHPGCLLDSVRGIGPALQTFDTFIPVKGAEKALKAAKALAHGEGGFAWLLIYGGTGNGKTHLAHAIARVTRDRRLDVKMVLAADLLSMLREAIKDHTADELLRRFKDMPFLIIDDYGVEYGSDWESAKIDELMTSRYATAKPTVLITNKAMSELPDRIRSRFEDSVMSRAIHNSAPDFRSRKGHKEGS